MSINSFAFRLFATAAALSLIILPVAGFVLISLYRGAVEEAFDARLNLYLTSLGNDSLKDADTLNRASAPKLGEPLFSIPFSGWYWQITPIGNGPSTPLSSDSLLDRLLPLPSRNGVPLNDQQKRIADINGPENQKLRILEQEIISENGSKTRKYSFAVAGDRTDIDRTVHSFQTLLAIALGLLGLGLVLATLVQVRFGLRPLAAMRRELASIRSGAATNLEGEYPDEIAPLQSELNALIQANHDIVERSRTHVGNLAHALKTPLSVITNEARGARGQLADKVAEQARVMQDQITHHLDRARVAARVGVIGSVTNVSDILTPLVRALHRIHEQRNIRIDVSCSGQQMFQGEKQDLEEMTGNLLDNACKWASSRVWINVASETSGRSQDSRNELVITVEDDGPGLTREEMVQVLKRGGRLDESKPGSGLGLAIVHDLAHLYKGEMILETSPRGGLLARLMLPST